jgi:phospholipid/cholesterol/gamma-HCH transport system substrate-binding protein
MKTGTNIKVGFLFLAFLGLMLWATLIVKGGLRGLMPKGRPLVTRFESVENLKISDKVYFAGVPVGKVTKIDFRERFVDVHLLIQEDQVQIYRGAEFIVEDVSTLGGKQISITRGDPDKGPIDWTEIHPGKSRPTLPKAVEGVTSSLKQFIDENRESARQMMDNLRDASARVDVITKKINQGDGTVPKLLNESDLYDNLNDAVRTTGSLLSAIAEGKGSIGPLFTRPDIYENLEFITRQIVQGKGLLGQMLVDERLAGEIGGVVTNVERITRSIEEGRGTLGRLVNDPSLYDNIDSIAARLNRGEGTLGRLLTDEVLYSELTDLATNLKSVSTHLDSISDKIDKGEGTVGRLVNDTAILDKAEETLQEAKDVLAAFKKFKTFVGTSGKYLGHQRMMVGRLYLRVEVSPSKFLLVGGSWLGLDPTGSVHYEGDADGDRGDDVFFEPEIQLGFRYFDNLATLRLGLIEGQFGGGIDFDIPLSTSLGSSLRFTFDARVAYSDRDFDGDNIDENVSPLIARFEASIFLLDHVRLFAGAHNFFGSIGFTGGIAFEYHDDDIKNLVGFMGLAG